MKKTTLTRTIEEYEALPFMHLEPGDVVIHIVDRYIAPEQTPKGWTNLGYNEVEVIEQSVDPDFYVCSACMKPIRNCVCETARAIVEHERREGRAIANAYAVVGLMLAVIASVLWCWP